MDKSLFYDPSQLLSYNRLMNFVIGARGIGKTYSCKKYVINRFLKTGAMFVYVRRYKTELKKVKTFFKDVGVEFPDVEFKVLGRELYINNKLAGYAIPLSSWQSEKSNAYPDVETIMFDEFIREKDNSRYLPNEVNAFMNLVHTIIRVRDNLRVICLSNSVSIVNPYFLYFSLVPDIKKRFNTKGECVVEIPKLDSFMEEVKKTRFGRLIAGTEYAEMALENKFVGDNYTFVEKRSKDSSFVYAVTYDGVTFGVFVDQYYMYVSNSFNSHTRFHYVIKKEDMADGRTLVRGRNNHHVGKLLSAFEKGLLRFDNLTLRNIGYEVLKKI